MLERDAQPDQDCDGTGGVVGDVHARLRDLDRELAALGLDVHTRAVEPDDLEGGHGDVQPRPLEAAARTSVIAHVRQVDVSILEVRAAFGAADGIGRAGNLVGRAVDLQAESDPLAVAGSRQHRDHRVVGIDDQRRLGRKSGGN